LVYLSDPLHRPLSPFAGKGPIFYINLAHRKVDMKRAIVAVVVGFAVLAICRPYLCSADDQQSKAEAKIMQDKLKAGQKMLEGIALAKFDIITGSADELIHLTNLAEWQVHKTPKYELFTNEFRRAAENVVAKSKAKSMDGVTLAYFELTMSCVRCHQYLREMREGTP